MLTRPVFLLPVCPFTISVITRLLVFLIVGREGAVPREKEVESLCPSALWKLVTYNLFISEITRRLDEKTDDVDGHRGWQEATELGQK